MKWMHALLIAVSVIFAVSARSESLATAASESDALLESILRAKDLRTIQEKVHATKTLTEQRRLCELQLKTSRIPDACFRVLELERGAGQLSSQKIMREKEWLIRVCRERALLSADFDEVERVASHKNLPESCRSLVQQRSEDLRYRAERESPAALFARRFGVKDAGPDFVSLPGHDP